jgi:hypothetical protein
MSDEIDREITSRKVTSTSNSNTPVNGYKVSEERSTRVSNDNSSGVIIGVLLFLAVGAGAIVYFLNNRPTTTPILTPSVDTVRENKSTVIERNNTTIKEVSPAATPQSTPKIEITVPAATVQPQPVAPAPAPAVTVTAQPTATPVAPPKATTPSPVPTPTTGSPNN